MEFKKTVTPLNWEKIKLQWHGAWLHSKAIAAVLEIKVDSTPRFVVGFREEQISGGKMDPVLLKQNSSGFNAFQDWKDRITELPELGKVQFEMVHLNKEGYGNLRVDNEVVL